MAGSLYLKDMQKSVFDDLKNLSEIRLSNKNKENFLSSKYKGLLCFLHETDYDHHEVYFLSKITGVSLGFGQEGMKVVAKFSEEGAFQNLDTDADFGAYYKLVKNRINREHLDNLLKKKPQKLVPSRGARTYHTKPEVELIPKKIREQEEICDEIFLISDGKDFLKL